MHFHTSGLAQRLVLREAKVNFSSMSCSGSLWLRVKMIIFEAGVIRIRKCYLSSANNSSVGEFTRITGIGQQFFFARIFFPHSLYVFFQRPTKLMQINLFIVTAKFSYETQWIQSNSVLSRSYGIQTSAKARHGFNARAWNAWNKWRHLSSIIEA